MEDQELLRSAVLAARSGQRQPARALFLQVIEQDPGCELAWLWLSELHEEPAERIAALERALHIRPANRTAQERLDQLRAQFNVTKAPPPPAAPAPTNNLPAAPVSAPPEPSVPPASRSAAPFILEDRQDGEPRAADEPELPGEDEQDACQQARRLAKTGQSDLALNLLYQLVQAQPQRGDAWLLIAQITPRGSEKINALQKVAELYPQNQKVRSHLQRLQALEQNPFLAGQQHEERGERAQALLVYEWIKVHSRSPADRMEAMRRIDNLCLIEEAERLQPVNPTLNLLRLTSGPLILFSLLVFIQSGLNPLKLPLVALLGEVSVLAGSLLVNVTGLRPMHPRWVKAFGRPGTPAELEMRFDLRLLGWALLAAPFLIFFITALHRLLQFRAAMEY